MCAKLWHCKIINTGFSLHRDRRVDHKYFMLRAQHQWKNQARQSSWTITNKLILLSCPVYSSITWNLDNNIQKKHDQGFLTASLSGSRENKTWIKTIGYHTIHTNMTTALIVKFMNYWYLLDIINWGFFFLIPHRIQLHKSCVHIFQILERIGKKCREQEWGTDSPLVSDGK